MDSGEENLWSGGPIKLQGEAPALDVRLRYKAWGKLNRNKSNLVLLLPGSTGLRHWADTFIGSESAFDPSRFYVVSLDPIGGGGSTKPSDRLGAEFPAYTVEDSVDTQMRFVREHLEVECPFAVVGMSVGGNMALEWGRRGAERAVGWICGYRNGGRCYAMLRAFDEIVALDPVFAGGRYVRQPEAGLKAAAAAYLPMLYGPDYLDDLSGEALERASTAMTESWLLNWDANDLLCRYRSTSRYDLREAAGGDLKEACKAVTAQVLLLPSTSDQLAPPGQAAELARHLPNSVCRPINSRLGHFAPLAGEHTPEHAAFAGLTAEFLRS